MKKIKLFIIVLFLCAICSIGTYIYAENSVLNAIDVTYEIQLVQLQQMFKM